MGRPFSPFKATVVRAIDGDSVVVRRDSDKQEERVRVGGVNVPSRGHNAEAGKRLINGWRGRRVSVRPTASYRVHSEIPAIVVDKAGNNLGMQLLAHGRRLHQFPIEAPLLAFYV
tara:strand:- start:1796 stop:2140 length:345 start_codon:yes stop_codon:yes gene_type:complete